MPVSLRSLTDLAIDISILLAVGLAAIVMPNWRRRSAIRIAYELGRREGREEMALDPDQDHESVMSHDLEIT